MEAVELREVLPHVVARTRASSPMIGVGGSYREAPRSLLRSGGEGATMPRCQEDTPQPPASAGPAPAEEKTIPRSDDGTQGGAIQSLPLSKRLAAHLGLGERPELRWMLYYRLEFLVKQHGPKMELLIREALTLARGKTNQGHYFCRAIKAKIFEAGFLEVLP